MVITHSQPLDASPTKWGCGTARPATALLVDGHLRELFDALSQYFASPRSFEEACEVTASVQLAAQGLDALFRDPLVAWAAARIDIRLHGVFEAFLRGVPAPHRVPDAGALAPGETAPGGTC